jgi:hypothetical protein
MDHRTSRRGFLAALLVSAAVVAPDHSLATILALRGGKPSGIGNTLIFSSPSAPPARAPYLASEKPPAMGTEVFICLPVGVPQDEEAVDLAAVCYEPASTPAASITLTGTATQWFKVLSNTKIAIRDAVRGTIPTDTWYLINGVASNVTGSCDPFTVAVWVPSPGNSVFFSPTGNDLTGNGAVNSPYQHVPKTAAWTGTGGANGGPQFTNKTFIFKAGKHQYELGTYNSGILFAVNHPGCKFAWNSWQGQAMMSGDIDEAGGFSIASSGETFGAAATGTLEKITFGSAVLRHQPVNCGAEMYRMSQFPRPNDLWKCLDPQSAADGTNNYNSTTKTSDGGFMPVFATTNSSDTTPKRIYMTPTGVNCYWQDSDLDVRFNNASMARNAAGVGVYVGAWVHGNFVNYVNVLEYDVTLHRAYFDVNAYGFATPSGDVNSIALSSGTTAICLFNSPYDVRVAGQYAVLPGSSGLTGIVFRNGGAAAGQCSVSRWRYGIGWGDVSGHIHFQAWVQRYAGGSGGGGGTAITCRNNDPSGTAWATGLAIYGLKVTQMNQEDEDGCAFEVSGTTGIKDFIIDRVHVLNNVRGRGCRATGPMLGLLSGSGPGGYPTMMEVINYAYGKMRWWFCDQGGVSLTFDLQQNMRGVEQLGWSARDFKGAHADGHAISVFNTSGSYYDHNVIRNEFVDLALRWFTTDVNDVFLPPTAQWINWIVGGVYLGEVQATNVGIMMQTGWPGGYMISSIVMTSARSADVSGLPALYIGGGWGMQILGCIINGLGVNNTAHGSTTATYTVDSTGWTGTQISDDVANSRRNTNPTTLSAMQKWDGFTIPTAWKSILQRGAGAGTTKIGRSHYV